MNNSNRLRIAIQKGGRLSKDCQDLLKQLGVKLNLREQRLIAHSTNMPIDVLRVRDDDIPGLVMDGVCDLGIVGENVLVEVQAERERQGVPSEVTKLSKLVLAVNVEVPVLIFPAKVALPRLDIENLSAPAVISLTVKTPVLSDNNPYFLPLPFVFSIIILVPFVTSELLTCNK